MAEQNFDVKKRTLSSSATPQPMNKMSTLEATRSQGPSPGQELTPPLLKHIDREVVTSPSNFPTLKQTQVLPPVLHNATANTKTPEHDNSFMVPPQHCHPQQSWWLAANGILTI
ncbi:hypothetical protein DSO57_1009960 [Entomophthora muscae]|uniref:Uncharacterized protein n=1 Tax=Entomophthora muscae TaxID=34485 RepID=A0ACC2UFN1_9FUNG|nr:hypothetical protein DSO57_1009960 [Entomophthora muscae]